VKQVMQNHIQLEKLICWNIGLHISTRRFRIRNLSNRIAPPSEENNSKKSKKRSVRKRIQYPNRSYTTPLNSTLTEVITTIKKKKILINIYPLWYRLHTHAPLKSFVCSTRIKSMIWKITSR
jgi:hypothetical protein